MVRPGNTRLRRSQNMTIESNKFNNSSSIGRPIAIQNFFKRRSVENCVVNSVWKRVLVGDIELLDNGLELNIPGIDIGFGTGFDNKNQPDSTFNKKLPQLNTPTQTAEKNVFFYPYPVVKNADDEIQNQNLENMLISFWNRLHQNNESMNAMIGEDDKGAGINDFYKKAIQAGIDNYEGQFSNGVDTEVDRNGVRFYNWMQKELYNFIWKTAFVDMVNETIKQQKIDEKDKIYLKTSDVTLKNFSKDIFTQQNNQRPTNIFYTAASFKLDIPVRILEDDNLKFLDLWKDNNTIKTNVNSHLKNSVHQQILDPFYKIIKSVNNRLLYRGWANGDWNQRMFNIVYEMFHNTNVDNPTDSATATFSELGKKYRKDFSDYIKNVDNVGLSRPSIAFNDLGFSQKNAPTVPNSDTGVFNTTNMNNNIIANTTDDTIKAELQNALDIVFREHYLKKVFDTNFIVANDPASQKVKINTDVAHNVYVWPLYLMLENKGRVYRVNRNVYIEKAKELDLNRMFSYTHSPVILNTKTKFQRSKQDIIVQIIAARRSRSIDFKKKKVQNSVKLMPFEKRFENYINPVRGEEGTLEQPVIFEISEDGVFEYYFYGTTTDEDVEPTYVGNKIQVRLSNDVIDKFNNITIRKDRTRISNKAKEIANMINLYDLNGNKVNEFENKYDFDESGLISDIQVLYEALNYGSDDNGNLILKPDRTIHEDSIIFQNAVKTIGQNIGSIFSDTVYSVGSKNDKEDELKLDIVKTDDRFDVYLKTNSSESKEIKLKHLEVHLDEQLIIEFELKIAKFNSSTFVLNGEDVSFSNSLDISQIMDQLIEVSEEFDDTYEIDEFGVFKLTFFTEKTIDDGSLLFSIDTAQDIDIPFEDDNGNPIITNIIQDDGSPITDENGIPIETEQIYTIITDDIFKKNMNQLTFDENETYFVFSTEYDGDKHYNFTAFDEQPEEKKLNTFEFENKYNQQTTNFKSDMDKKIIKLVQKFEFANFSKIESIDETGEINYETKPIINKYDFQRALIFDEDDLKKYNIYKRNRMEVLLFIMMVELYTDYKTSKNVIEGEGGVALKNPNFSQSKQEFSIKITGLGFDEIQILPDDNLKKKYFWTDYVRSGNIYNQSTILSLKSGTLDSLSLNNQKLSGQVVIKHVKTLGEKDYTYPSFTEKYTFYTNFYNYIKNAAEEFKKVETMFLNVIRSPENKIRDIQILNNSVDKFKKNMEEAVEIISDSTYYVDVNSDDNDLEYKNKITLIGDNQDIIDIVSGVSILQRMYRINELLKQENSFFNNLINHKTTIDNLFDKIPNILIEINENNITLQQSNIKTVYETQINNLKKAGVYEEPEVNNVVVDAYAKTSDNVYIENVEPFGFYYDIGDNNKDTLKKFKENKKLVDDKLKELAEKEMTPKTAEILKGNPILKLYTNDAANNIAKIIIDIENTSRQSSNGLFDLKTYFGGENIEFANDFEIKTLIDERERLKAVLKRTDLTGLTTNYNTLKNKAGEEVEVINEIVVIYYYYKMAVLEKTLTKEEKERLKLIEKIQRIDIDDGIIAEADKANSNESKNLANELNEIIDSLKKINFDDLNTISNADFIDLEENTRIFTKASTKLRDVGDLKQKFEDKIGSFEGTTKIELNKDKDDQMVRINLNFIEQLKKEKRKIEVDFYESMDLYISKPQPVSYYTSNYIRAYQSMEENFNRAFAIKIVSSGDIGREAGKLDKTLKIENILTGVFETEYKKLIQLSASTIETPLFTTLKVLYENVFKEAKNTNFNIFKRFNEESSKSQKEKLQSFFVGIDVISELKRWRNKIGMITILNLSNSIETNADLKKLYDVRLVQQLFEFDKELNEKVKGEGTLVRGGGLAIQIPEISNYDLYFNVFFNPYHAGKDDDIIKTTYDILKNKFDVLNLYASNISVDQTTEVLINKYRKLRTGVNYVDPPNRDTLKYFGDEVNDNLETIYNLQNQNINEQIEKDNKKASEKALEKIKNTQLFKSNLSLLKTANNLDAIYNSESKSSIKFQYGKSIKDYDLDPNDTPSKTIEDYNEDKKTIEVAITQFITSRDAGKKVIDNMKKYTFNEIQKLTQSTTLYNQFIEGNVEAGGLDITIYEIENLDFDDEEGRDGDFSKDNNLTEMENRLNSYNNTMIENIKKAFMDKYNKAIEEIEKKKKEQQAAQEKLNEIIYLKINYNLEDNDNFGYKDGSRDLNKIPSYTTLDGAPFGGEQVENNLFKSGYQPTDSEDWVDFQVRPHISDGFWNLFIKIKKLGSDRRSGIHHLFIKYNDSIENISTYYKLKHDKDKKIINLKDASILESSFYGSLDEYKKPDKHFGGDNDNYQLLVTFSTKNEYKGIKAHFDKLGVESGATNNGYTPYSVWWDKNQGRLYNLRVSSVKPTIINESDEKIRGFDIPEHLMKSRGVVEDLHSILGDYDGNKLPYEQKDDNLLYSAIQKYEKNGDNGWPTQKELDEAKLKGESEYKKLLSVYDGTGKNNSLYRPPLVIFKRTNIQLTRYVDSNGKIVVDTNGTPKVKVHPLCKYGQRLYAALANIKPAGPDWEQLNALTFTIPKEEKSVYFVLQRDNNSEDQQNKNYRIIITTGSGLEIPNDIVKDGPKFYGANIHFTGPIQNLNWGDSLSKDNDIVIKDSKSDDKKSNIAFLKYTSDKGYDYTGILCEFNTSKTDIRLSAKESILTFMKDGKAEKVSKDTSQASSREKFSRLRPLGFNVEKKIDNNRVKLVAVDHKRAAVVLENVKDLTSFEINISDRNNNVNVSSCSLTGDKFSDLEAVKRIYNNSKMIDPELLPTTSILKENVEQGNGIGFRILATSLDEKPSFSKCIFCGIIRVENMDQTVLPAIDNLNIEATML